MVVTLHTRHFTALAVGLAALSNGCKTVGNSANKVQSINGALVASDDPVARSTVGIIWDNKNNGTSGCSGTLVDRRHVVTAAHCFDPNLSGKDKNIKITFGLNRKAPTATISISGDPISHPQYSNPNTGFSNADVAVVTLSEDAPSDATPVALATLQNKLKKNDVVTLAGYGRTDEDDRSSADILHKLPSNIQYGSPLIPSISVSAPNGSGCFGDSGGPVFINDNSGQLVLTGIFSTGDTSRYQCPEGSINNVTDVRYLNDWLTAVLTGKPWSGGPSPLVPKFTDTDGKVYAFCSKYNHEKITNGFAKDPSLNGVNDNQCRSPETDPNCCGLKWE